MLEGINNINAYVKNDETATKMAQKLTENQEKLSTTTTSTSTSKNNNRLSAIKRKMQQGKKLSATDMSYLRKNAPQLHSKAKRIERIRQDFELKLKSCKTKDEFNRLRATVTQATVDIGNISSTAVSSDAGISPNTNITIPQTTDASTSAVTTTDTVSSDTTARSQPTSYEPDDSGMYLYHSLDDAYRAYKHTSTYTKLPQTYKTRHEKNRMNFKI